VTTEVLLFAIRLLNYPLSLYNDGFVYQFLNVMHNCCLLGLKLGSTDSVGFCGTSTCLTGTQKHKLAHHSDLFLSYLGDLLLVGVLCFKVSEPLTEHKHVLLGKAFVYDCLELLKEHLATHS